MVLYPLFDEGFSFTFQNKTKQMVLFPLDQSILLSTNDFSDFLFNFWVLDLVLNRLISDTQFRSVTGQKHLDT